MVDRNICSSVIPIMDQKKEVHTIIKYLTKEKYPFITTFRIDKKLEKHSLMLRPKSINLRLGLSGQPSHVFEGA